MSILPLFKHKISLLCLQKIRWTREGSREIKVDGCKLWYTRNANRRNGVDIVVDEEWRENVVGVKRIMDQIISVKVIVRLRS